MEFFEKAIVRTPSETYAKGITPGFLEKRIHYLPLISTNSTLKR